MNNGPKVPMNLPGNSHSSKAQNKPEKNIQKIVAGSVMHKKKGLGTKFAETFLGDTVDSVSDYVLKDIIIPAGLNMASSIMDEFLNIIRGGTDMMLFGESRSRHKYRSGGRAGGTNYSTIANNVRGVISSPGRATNISKVNNAAVNQIDDVLLDNRGDVELVLDKMQDIIEEYGFVSVADLYEMVGKNHTFADQNHGWSVLDRSSVIRNRDGWYQMRLPKTLVLD